MAQDKEGDKGKNVIDVDYDSQLIKAAIEKQIKIKKYKSNYLYGNGYSADKIIEVIKDLNINIQKKNSF